MPWPHSWSMTPAISPVLRHWLPLSRNMLMLLPSQKALQVCCDVDVGGELALQPGVVRQVALGLLDDAVHLVEAGSRGVRVARGVAGRHRAVGAGAETEVGMRGRWRTMPPRGSAPQLSLIFTNRPDNVVRGDSSGRRPRSGRRRRCCEVVSPSVMVRSANGIGKPGCSMPSGGWPSLLTGKTPPIDTGLRA